MTPDPRDESAAATTLRDALVRIGGIDPGLVPFALGWATVDLDRAERSFLETFAGRVEPIDAGPDDVLLGARCRTLRATDPGMPLLVLVEPATEGRLAALLARHGEGPAVAWLRSMTVVGRPAGFVAADGPFGPETLLPGGLRHGPHRLLVLAEAGTITS